MQTLLSRPTTALIATFPERIREYERFLAESIALHSGDPMDPRGTFHRCFWETAIRLSGLYGEMTHAERETHAIKDAFLEMAVDWFPISEKFRRQCPGDSALPSELAREWLRNTVSELCLWAEAATYLHCGNHPILYTPRLEIALTAKEGIEEIRVAAHREDGTKQEFTEPVEPYGEASAQMEVIAVLPLDFYSLPDPVIVEGAISIRRIVCHFLGREFVFVASATETQAGTGRLHHPVETVETVFGNMVSP
jgi:hypothetical protein